MMDDGDGDGGMHERKLFLVFWKVQLILSLPNNFLSKKVKYGE